MLQRSRGRKAPETVRVTSRVTAIRGLQRSRGRKAPETLDAEAMAQEFSQRLQRSRGRKAPETSACLTSGSSWPCRFNGAGAGRPRRRR